MRVGVTVEVGVMGMGVGSILGTLLVLVAQLPFHIPGKLVQAHLIQLVERLSLRSRARARKGGKKRGQ